MNILVLASEIPATSSMPGSPRLFNLCRYLSRTHRLWLVTGCQIKERYEWFTSEPGTRSVFQSIQVLPEAPAPTWWNRQIHRLHVAPYFLTRYLNPGYHHAVVNIIEEYLAASPPVDLLYVDGLGMTQYADRTRAIPVVVDLHDSLTLLYSRLVEGEKRLLKKIALYLGKRGIAKLEQSLHKFCDLIITNSKVDEQVIKRLSPSGHALTVTNGVDIDYFSSCAEPENAAKLIFTGVMDYEPNEDAALYFAKEIFPLVKRTFAEAEFWIVGSGPSATIRALASQPGIYVTGRVDDVRPYLQTANIFVCPLRFGAGMKNKILAAMAMRKAIVATPLSLEGIDVRAGEEVLVADSPAEFARQVGRLLTDKKLTRRLGEDGRKLVKERYSWSARGQVLESSLLNVAAHHSNTN
jgi:glycosyltransferase involved in cell wall biosynthesis